MPVQKISEKDALGEAPASDDLFPLVDVSDTTEAASATTGQPVSASNVVTCIGASGKRGRITAQLQIRSTIQSIAYST